MPFLLVLLVALNAALVRAGAVYRVTLLAQLAFYGAAAGGWWLRRSPLGRARVFFVLLFFSAANVAALVGCARLVGGRQTVLWKRTRA